MSKYWLL